METMILDAQEVEAIPSANTEVFDTPSSNFLLPADAKASLVDGVQRNALGLESSATHKHVAKVWQETCVPWNDFSEMIKVQAVGKEDRKEDISKLSVTDELTLPDGMEFTEHGLSSLVAKFTNYPPGHLKYHSDFPEDNADVARYINRELDIRRASMKEKQDKKITSKFAGVEKQVLIRMRPDPATGRDLVCRAVCSDLYGVYGNDELVTMIGDAMTQTPNGGKMNDALVSHLYSDLDRMHGNILFPDSMKEYPDSDYGVGMYFSNSEIATDTLKVSPFLFRAICLNGCIWGRSDASFTLNKRHLGAMNREDIASYILNACTLGLSEGRSFMTQMEYSKEAPIGRPFIPRVITYLSKANKLSIAESRAWYSAFLIEPEWENAFGVVNALTRAANGYKGDAQRFLQTLGADILTPSLTADVDAVKAKWSKVLSRSKDMSEKEVEKCTRLTA